RLEATTRAGEMPARGGRQPPDPGPHQGAAALRSPAFTLQGRRVCWSPDGTHLATVCKDGTAKVWDARDGRLLLNLHGHRSAVTAVSWSPEGNRLATAGADGTGLVWDVARQR